MGAQRGHVEVCCKHPCHTPSSREVFLDLALSWIRTARSSPCVPGKRVSASPTHASLSRRFLLWLKRKEGFAAASASHREG